MPAEILTPLDMMELSPGQPLYIMVAAQLRRQVRDGTFKPGDQLPSFYEMKARHGLSQATMERAHTILLQEGLIERRRGLGTFVAVPPATKTTGVVGVLMGDASQHHPYYLHLLQSVREVALHENIELLLLHDKSTVRWEKVDGVLLIAPTPEPLRLPDGMECVSLLFTVASVPSVVADDSGGVRAAIQYLQKIGHKKIAFMTQAATSNADKLSLQRLSAYREALDKDHIESGRHWVRGITERWREGSGFLELARQRMRQWLLEDWQELGCTAILAQNDEAAMGIVEALEEFGLRVPQDVSVVGFDGTEVSTYFRPRLTTVEIPLQEIGARGFAQLREQMRTPTTVAKGQTLVPHVLSTILRVRESTAPPKL